MKLKARVVKWNECTFSCEIFLPRTGWKIDSNNYSSPSSVKKAALGLSRRMGWELEWDKAYNSDVKDESEIFHTLEEGIAYLKKKGCWKNEEDDN